MCDDVPLTCATHVNSVACKAKLTWQLPSPTIESFPRHKNISSDTPQKLLRNVLRNTTKVLAQLPNSPDPSPIEHLRGCAGMNPILDGSIP